MLEHESMLENAEAVLAALNTLPEAGEAIAALMKWLPAEVGPVGPGVLKELEKIKQATGELRRRLGGKSELTGYIEWPLPILINRARESQEEIRRLRTRNQRLRTILRNRFEAAITEAEDRAEAASRERLAGAMREAFAANAAEEATPLPSAPPQGNHDER